MSEPLPPPAKLTHTPSGCPCPNCGQELIEDHTYVSNPFCTLLSCPQQHHVYCINEKCRWMGYKVLHEEH